MKLKFQKLEFFEKIYSENFWKFFMVLDFTKLEYPKSGRFLHISETVVDCNIVCKKVLFGYFCWSNCFQIKRLATKCFCQGNWEDINIPWFMPLLCNGFTIKANEPLSVLNTLTKMESMWFLYKFSIKTSIEFFHYNTNSPPLLFLGAKYILSKCNKSIFEFIICVKKILKTEM